MNVFDFQMHDVGFSAHQVALTVARHSVFSDDIISITPLMAEAEIDAYRDSLKLDLDAAADRAKEALNAKIMSRRNVGGGQHGL